jgi:hypothetical protein
MPNAKSAIDAAKSGASTFIETPVRIVLDSFLSSFLFSSITVYGAIGEANRHLAGAIAAPVIGALTVAAVWAWNHDEDLWESFCHPFRRSERLRKVAQAEREELEAAEREERARAKRAEFQRWHSLKRLSGDERIGRSD